MREQILIGMCILLLLVSGCVQERMTLEECETTQQIYFQDQLLAHQYYDQIKECYAWGIDAGVWYVQCCR